MRCHLEARTEQFETFATRTPPEPSRTFSTLLELSTHPSLLIHPRPSFTIASTFWIIRPPSLAIACVNVEGAGRRIGGGSEVHKKASVALGSSSSRF
jgi:hypothetical protein